MDDVAISERFPTFADLRERARRRVPHFAFEYLDSATGLEMGLLRNRDALDRVLLTPRFMKGELKPQLQTRLFGKTWSAPCGVAPVGLTGMMWPRGEIILAQAAAGHGIPYCLSSVACEAPEAVGPAAQGNAWFQLYPIADKDAEGDILNRARSSGFEVLVVTVDVPVGSTRERQRRAGLTNPKTGVSKLLQMASRPQWLLETAKRGQPRFRTMEKYVSGSSMAEIARFAVEQRLGMTGPDSLKLIRDRWKGPLVIKGVLAVEDALACLDLGADGIVVSNHGARQLDCAPASIDVLPQIAKAIDGRIAVMFDSGVRTGLDIARALALGADFVLAGRAFIQGVCALGERGGRHVARMLSDDLANNMIQLGVRNIEELRALARPGPPSTQPGVHPFPIERGT